MRMPVMMTMTMTMMMAVVMTLMMTIKMAMMTMTMKMAMTMTMAMNPPKWGGEVQFLFTPVHPLIASRFQDWKIHSHANSQWDGWGDGLMIREQQQPQVLVRTCQLNWRHVQRHSSFEFSLFFLQVFYLPLTMLTFFFFLFFFSPSSSSSYYYFCYYYYYYYYYYHYKTK